MNNFTFYSPTEFVLGKGVENQVGELCARYGAKRVMIVYDGTYPGALYQQYA